ncbi:MAG: metal-dependent transcriptional regulator [Anaerolineales bacterium]|jgi:DtxR family Mn-dependent transcriptional regulator
MRKELTHAVEDYLKAIYEISLEDGRASTTRLAVELGVTPASVTGMLQKLSGMPAPLIEYKKHHGASLTPDGERVALEIIRHHRLIEMFLQERLGYTWDEVHDEADRLEHVISEGFEDRIARDLGHPAYDPHGDPIPSSDLQVPEFLAAPLNEMSPCGRVIIRRVRDSDADLLRYLSELGIMPQVEIELLERSPYDGNLTLKVVGGDAPVVLGPQVTCQIYVEALNSEAS